MRTGERERMRRRRRVDSGRTCAPSTRNTARTARGKDQWIVLRSVLYGHCRRRANSEIDIGIDIARKTRGKGEVVTEDTKRERALCGERKEIDVRGPMKAPMEPAMGTVPWPFIFNRRRSVPSPSDAVLWNAGNLRQDEAMLREKTIYNRAGGGVKLGG